MKCNFDERQLWIRGDVYKHGLFLMGGILLLDNLLRDFGMVWAGGRILDLSVLMVTVAFCSVEWICRDVYLALPIKQQDGILALLGVLAVALLFYSCIELFLGETRFFSHGQLAEAGLEIISSLCLLLICVAYLVKRLLGMRKDMDEED